MMNTIDVLDYAIQKKRNILLQGEFDTAIFKGQALIINGALTSTEEIESAVKEARETGKALFVREIDNASFDALSILHAVQIDPNMCLIGTATRCTALSSAFLNKFDKLFL